MRQLWQDVKFGARTLAKSPGFAIVAVLTLALGIGANTAIFSVVNTVLLRPLPYLDPDRIMMFLITTPQGAFAGGSATKFNAYREQSAAFQDVSAYRFGYTNVTGDADPVQVRTGQVSADFFRLFGVPIEMGRTFTDQEDRTNAGNVVVIGNGFWKRRFGGDPQIVGKTISLSGTPYQVIGVLGPNFETPNLDDPPDVWLAFRLDPNSIDQANYFSIAGRLKPGVTQAAANAQLQLAADEFRHRYAGIGALGPNQSFWVKPLQEVTIEDVRSPLHILIGAVSLVLLIACANVANLLLVRANGRKREIAIRAALGAGRGVIIRQLLTESMMLSLTGGALGLLLGVVGIRALLAESPGNIPRIGSGGGYVALDWRVVLFTIGISLLTGVIFGAIPAFQVSRVEFGTTLKEGGRSGASRRQNRVRSLLVVGELTVAVLLLVGAALLIRTFVALRSVDPGFVVHNVTTMRTSLTAGNFENTASVEQLIRSGLRSVRAVPGVVAASATCCIPLDGGYGLPFIIAGRPLDGPSHGGAAWLTISSGYFETFQIPILRGRSFNDSDTTGSPPVAIISQAMARQYWPKGDPLSDRLIIGKGVGPEFENDPPRQIIGVAGDVRLGALSGNPGPAMYVPWGQTLDGVNALNVRLSQLKWVIRTGIEPQSVNHAIEKALREGSGGLPVGGIRSMQEIVAHSTARQNFNMILMSIFAGCALVLTAVGIYGLMSYSVQQRTQEIGVRLALGAEASAVRGMVVLQGMRLALIGVAIGIAAAFACARLIASFLFGVKPWDPTVFVAAPLALILVALLATWAPALRASRVSPIEALRYE